MNSFKAYFKQTKAVYIILLSIIVNGIGGLIAQFMTLILKHDLGLNEFTVSLILSSTLGLSIVGGLIGGRLADFYSPRKIKYLSGFAFGSINIIIAFIGASLLVIPLFMFSSFVIGFAASTNSMLIYIHANEEERKNAFSLVYVAINVAAAVSPIIAAYVHKNYGFFLLFFLDGLTTIAAAYLIFTLDEKEAVEKKEKTKIDKSVPVIKVLRENKAIAFTLITMAFYFVTFSQQKSLLAFQTLDFFGDTWRSVWAIMFTINGVMCMLIPPFVSVFLKSLKAKNMIMLSGVLYAFGFYMYALTSNPYVFYMATAIWTLGEIAGAIMFEVYIAEVAPSTHRGRVFALSPIMRRAGQIVGILIGGTLSTIFPANYLLNWGIIVLFPLIGVVLIKISHE